MQNNVKESKNQTLYFDVLVLTSQTIPTAYKTFCDPNVYYMYILFSLHQKCKNT